MNKTKVIRGFKIFNPDWTCRNKQYTCPGNFEEDVIPSIGNLGMHFCKKAADCFYYYGFNPENKVAEVVAYGTVVEEKNKCCTDKLEIIREIPWQELLEIVNIGKSNTGDYNSGNRNSGNRNSGNCNSGNHNSGNYNTGERNAGDYNSGYYNSGYYNSGYYNTGDYNSGNCNSGYYNSGNRNSGNHNSGNYNTGNYNTGNYNTGNYNTGNYNTGNYNTGERNTGDCNTGDYNETNFSNGCFNTIEQKIHLFNKASEWTYQDWMNSEACYLLNQIPSNVLEYVLFNDMTDEEKTAHPEAKITGGYLKELDNSECAVIWWRSLNAHQKNIITSIPNFDKVIFKEIIGIDVEI